MPNLDGVHVAMLGGDERELILTRALLQQRARVTVVGYPHLSELAGAEWADTVKAAVTAADVVVAPMSNTDETGVVKAHLDPEAHLVLDEEAFRAMGAGKPLLIGLAKPIIEALAARFQVRLVQMAELDEIAILNSIPTAEGAIHRAMTELPVTVHGSRAVVVGFGRCAATLARMLHGMGAKVRVVARDGGQLARAYEIGLETARLDDLKACVHDATVVFNTVPALILTRSVLERVSKETLVIDVASSPGGTDFEAAAEFGIKAILDLGIPGRVAPQTAGEILAKVIPGLIRAECDAGA